MAIDLSGFNAEEVIEETADLGGDFELLPSGDYSAMLVKAEMKETRAGNGSYINAQFMITDGEFEKRRVFVIYNWTNPNKKAVDIGKREFANLCRACGNNAPDDVDDLFDIEIGITLGIQKGKGDYPDSNRIKKYHRIGGAVEEKKEEKPKKKKW